MAGVCFKQFSFCFSSSIVLIPVVSTCCSCFFSTKASFVMGAGHMGPLSSTSRSSRLRLGSCDRSSGLADLNSKLPLQALMESSGLEFKLVSGVTLRFNPRLKFNFIVLY